MTLHVCDLKSLKKVFIFSTMIYEVLLKCISTISTFYSQTFVNYKWDTNFTAL